MEKYMIRRAIMEDLKDIQTLNNKLFEYEYEGWDKDLKLGWPFEEEGVKYFTNIINTEVVFIALDKEKIIGYIAGSTKGAALYITIKVAEIENIFVEEDYRGAGIGSLLIQTFKEECKKSGINTFKVNASWDNKRAIEVYKKSGFSEHDITLWCKE